MACNCCLGLRNSGNCHLDYRSEICVGGSAGISGHDAASEGENEGMLAMVEVFEVNSMEDASDFADTNKKEIQATLKE